MKRLFTVLTVASMVYVHSAQAQVGNYFAGYQSGTSNTGNYNAFVGYQASVNGNSGWYNTFMGYQAGYLSTSASYNTFIGSFAGYDNTLGLSNTFVGWAAGSNNVSASSNSFFGNLAGYSNSTGGSNSFFGSASAYLNTTGNQNAFFGSRSGYNNNGSNNTFIGYATGEKTTTGSWNAFLGGNAGFANTTGEHNTFAGTRSGVANTTGYRNAFFGTEAGMQTTTGRENTFIGRSAGRNNTTGSFNTTLGNYAQTSAGSINYSTAIGHKSYVRVSNAVVIGSINGENSANVTTNVGIGTSAPSYLLHVNGVAAKPGGGSWTVASDKRLKKDIQPFNEGLDQVLQINPVWFSYNGKAGMPTDRRYVGIIAQEIQKIAPHTVSEFTHENVEGGKEQYLDYDANAVNYMLINAVKELNAMAVEQAKIIQDLKEEIAALKKGTPLPETSDRGGAQLFQNIPNPYAASTVIPYYIPETSGSAKIIVYSVTGQEVYSQLVSTFGKGEIEIPGTVLSNGNYVYQLVVDGRIADKKKMVVAK